MLCLVAQSYPTLCDPTDWGPPGSSVHGDSPGKNTGIECHALFQGIFPTQGLNEPRSPVLQADSLPSEPPGKPKGHRANVCCALVAQSCPTLCDPMDCSPPDSSVHGDSPGKYTGVGYKGLLQGILPTQGSTQVSHISGGFFTV